MVKRSKIEIEKLKTKMLRLLSSGLTYSDIEKIMKEQDNLPPRTFARYWKTLMKQEEEKLFKQKKDLLVGFIKRHEKRLRDAQVNFAQTNNLKWWYACHNAEIDFMKLMATIGALDVKPEELKVTLETRFLDALEEVRREQREAKRNNT